MTNAFDIETFIDEKNDILKPYCLCFIKNNTSGSYYGTDCVSKFIDMIINDNVKIYYAHNLTFDGSFIISTLVGKKIKFESLILRNNIYNIKILYKNKTINLKCSYRLFPYSLSRASKILGCTPKIDFDYKNINAKNINLPNIKELTINYCLNDVKIVIEILNIFNTVISPIYPN